MSRVAVFSVILMLVISTAGFSNVAINGKHKNLTAKKVDCAYCHTAQKIEKKKGQMADKKFNGKALSQVKACAGKDCHK